MVKYIQHPLTIIIITILVIIFITSSRNTIKNYQKTSESITTVEQENEKLSQEIANLEQKKAFSESDFAKEKIIRDELLLQKPGEYILQLPANLPPAPTPTPSPSPQPIEEWKQILLP